MSNVTLVIHLILALVLICVVLLQRSEGGGLGIGGGGGGGVMSGRQAATALGKLTWVCAVAFLCTSLALTILTAREQAGDSVLERLGDGAATEDAVGSGQSDDGPLSGQDLLPPTVPDSPALPPRAE